MSPGWEGDMQSIFDRLGAAVVVTLFAWVTISGLIDVIHRGFVSEQAGTQAIVAVCLLSFLLGCRIFLSGPRWSKMGWGWLLVPAMGVALLWGSLVWFDLAGCRLGLHCPAKASAITSASDAKDNAPCPAPKPARVCPPAETSAKPSPTVSIRPPDTAETTVAPPPPVSTSGLLAWLFEILRTIPYSGEVLAMLSGAGLLYLIPKYLHLLRIYVEVAFRPSITGVPYFAEPLPSQRVVINALYQATVRRGDAQPNTLALRGKWGSGKTASLRHYENCLTRDRSLGKPSAALVWFDCWRHQTESQPESALYWHVASNFSLLWPFGWLSVPALRLYLFRIPMVLKADWKIGGANVSFEDKAFKELPKAQYWQRRLEALTNLALGRRTRRVVIVLEDIDRCTALSAQVFVTLVRRFLSVPGISVVIPYVESQMDHKVFNPLGCQLPDLASSSEAALWQAFGARVREAPAVASPPHGSEMSAMFDEVRSRIVRDANVIGNGDDGDPENEKKADKDRKAFSPPTVVQGWLKASLLKEYACAERSRRVQLLNLLADKYLADAIIPIPMLTSEDCAELVIRQVRESSDVQRRILARAGMTENLIRDRLTVNFRETVFQVRSNPPQVSARQFSAALNQIFGSLNDDHLERLQQRCSEASPEDIPLLVWTLALMSFRYAVDRVFHESYAGEAA